MSKLCLVLLLAALALAVGTGCKSDSGAYQYIPGKGWVPNN
jgi:hypothetical protein